MSNQSAEQNAKLPRQYVNFSFYKLNLEWLKVNKGVRAAASSEFAEVIKSFQQKIMVYPYTTLGVRSDADFLLWRISYNLDDFEEMTAALRSTQMAPYLENVYSFLSMTKTSIYVSDHVHEGQEAARNKIVIGGAKYLFVYPFVKSREWYLMPQEERVRMMKHHITFGHEFPSVKLNTTYSFGLDDQDFVVAFESNHPSDFLDLVQGLRETEASRFTVRDTPIFTCTQQDINTIMKHISGL